jgi:hypothetical protein
MASRHSRKGRVSLHSAEPLNFMGGEPPSLHKKITLFE